MGLSYTDFLKTKLKTHTDSGFVKNNLHKDLFDFQKFIVQKALKAGKYAIFADCGLGKTFMQLVWANEVANHTNLPVLILCPLAVAGQTMKEAERFNLECRKYGQGKVQITNYEQLENVNASMFSGVVLDESSILKNFTGKYRNLIIERFANTPYKLACTATPSPNDPMELGNHAEFLGACSRLEMLAEYFVHDGGETSKWRLKGHATSRFWDFVGGWSIMLSKPQDIGFQADGYELPELKYFETQISTPKKENGQLFNEVAVSATNFNAELRITKIDRIESAAKIINESDESFILWIKQNEEGQLARELIKDAIEVKGSDKPEYKESKLLGFANDEFRVLITKAKIAQFGLNYQNCRNQVFASLDFSFESLYQSIRRSYRFGQKNIVNIYIITTDTMQNVVKSIKEKQKQFEEMQQKLTKRYAA